MQLFDYVIFKNNVENLWYKMEESGEMWENLLYFYTPIGINKKWQSS